MPGPEFDTSTPEGLKLYNRWCKEEAACVYCGRMWKDRPTDEEGRYLDLWLTETNCGCGMVVKREYHGKD